MKIFYGLGNWGKEFCGTRHNIGAETIKFFVEKRSTFTKLKSGIFSGFKNGIFFVAKGFMNLSGENLKKFIDEIKIDFDVRNLVVVYDDMDIPLGKIKIKPSGGSGGHKGVQSIIDKFGKDFIRIRIGIGRPPKGMKPDTWVLSKFSPDEKEKIPWDKIEASILLILEEKLSEAMTKFNSD